MGGLKDHKFHCTNYITEKYSPIKNYLHGWWGIDIDKVTEKVLYINLDCFTSLGTDKQINNIEYLSMLFSDVTQITDMIKKYGYKYVVIDSIQLAYYMPLKGKKGGWVETNEYLKEFAEKEDYRIGCIYSTSQIKEIREQ